MNADTQSKPPAAGNPLAPRIPILVCRAVNAAVIALIGLLGFVVPCLIVCHDLRDPRLRGVEIPQAAWRLHRTLTPKFARWAADRVVSSRATELSTHDISGTEWPLFGTVFYLWGTESLQAAWEKDHSLAPAAPKESAHAAIENAAALLVDPKQASWVKQHWGEHYLKRENVFYRMLLISGLTSHARLTSGTEHLPLLRDQVESLSAELAASPHGLLDDYPGECYPGDVLMAIAMIRKADGVLGTDHSAFVDRAIRGFQGKALDELGLAPYQANAVSGEPLGSSRGCGNSYMSLSSPGIWPEPARRWYDAYSQHFWQETSMLAGFREFPKEMVGQNWYFDVDSGPVLNGLGFAASAFGLGAARVNGHFEHAYPLTAELYAASWPLPNGTLLLPRLLSNAADAPFLGESAILYVLTQPPATGVAITKGGSVPHIVLLGLLVQGGLGLLLIASAIWGLRRWLRNREQLAVLLQPQQFVLWLALLTSAVILFLVAKPGLAAILFCIALLFPRCRRLRLSILPCPPS